MRFWAVAVKSLPRTKLMSVAVMNWPVREAESSAPRRWDSRSCISSRAWKRQRVGWALQRSMRQRRPSEVSNWQRLGLGSGACASASWLLFVVDTFLGIFMGNPQFEVTKQRSHDVTKRWKRLRGGGGGGPANPRRRWARTIKEDGSATVNACQG